MISSNENVPANLVDSDTVALPVMLGPVRNVFIKVIARITPTLKVIPDFQLRKLLLKSESCSGATSSGATVLFRNLSKNPM